MALLSAEPLEAVIFEVVLGASLEPLSFRDRAGEWIGFERAVTAGRPVTAAAIAQSIRLPQTTVLRRANALVTAGRLVRDRGFGVAAAAFADGRAEQVAAENAADLAEAAVRLAEAGHAAAAAFVSAGSAFPPPRVIERLLVANRLRTLEAVTDLYGDVVSAMIVPAIIAANVAQVTADTALAVRYAGEESPPPDTLRRPVTLRAIARDIPLPFETVRRRAVVLIESGVVVAVAGGVIVPTRVLMTEAQLSNNRRITRNFEEMLAMIAKLTSGDGAMGGD